MRRDDKFRFSLGWSRDTAEKIAVGDLLERLKNRKSDLVVQAVWEYIGNHPEVMTEDASGPSEKDLDDMLKNLDIFNL